MALTIFIKSDRSVAIVRWFLETNGNVDFASGPVVQMAFSDFRADGYKWIHHHFSEYLRLRLSRDQLVKVFQSGEAKRLMSRAKAVEINKLRNGELVFSPMAIRKYDLAQLEPIGSDARISIPYDSPPEVFWATFDVVVEKSPRNESSA